MKQEIEIIRQLFNSLSDDDKKSLIKSLKLEYSRGKNKPLAMKALLNLLNELDDDEIIKVIRKWKSY